MRTSNLCYLISLRHLIRSRTVTNGIFFSQKRTNFPSRVRDIGETEIETDSDGDRQKDIQTETDKDGDRHRWS